MTTDKQILEHILKHGRYQISREGNMHKRSRVDHLICLGIIKYNPKLFSRFTLSYSPVKKIVLDEIKFDENFNVIQ